MMNVIDEFYYLWMFYFPMGIFSGFMIFTHSLQGCFTGTGLSDSCRIHVTLKHVGIMGRYLSIKNTAKQVAARHVLGSHELQFVWIMNTHSCHSKSPSA